MPVFQQAHDDTQEPQTKRLVLVKAIWNDETPHKKQGERPSPSPLQVTESIDRELFPFKQNGWIVFMAGRSFVLGPSGAAASSYPSSLPRQQNGRHFSTVPTTRTSFCTLLRFCLRPVNYANLAKLRAKSMGHCVHR